jgi:hypothetical protein
MILPCLLLSSQLALPLASLQNILLSYICQKKSQIPQTSSIFLNDLKERGKTCFPSQLLFV